MHACTCIPRSAQGELNVLRQGSEDHTRGPDRTLCTVEPLLFISLPQVPQQRESKEYWSRNYLTVVTARVFYVVSGFFYFHPQCQGRRHLRFYVICEPRGAHTLMLQGREINLLFFIASTGDRSRVRWCAAPMLYTSATPPHPFLFDRKSPLIALLAISDQYATFFYFFFQNGGWRPFWKSDLGHFG